jgi:hypothetical protein
MELGLIVRPQIEGVLMAVLGESQQVLFKVAVPPHVVIVASF